jgi:hypothetical protein
MDRPDLRTNGASPRRYRDISEIFCSIKPGNFRRITSVDSLLHMNRQMGNHLFLELLIGFSSRSSRASVHFQLCQFISTPQFAGFIKPAIALTSNSHLD